MCCMRVAKLERGLRMVRVILNRGYLWGDGLPPMYGSYSCSKCGSKKIEIKERISKGVTEWQCKKCGYVWRYDRKPIRKGEDPYKSAGMTRNVAWDKENAKKIMEERMRRKRQ